MCVKSMEKHLMKTGWIVVITDDDSVNTASTALATLDSSEQDV